MMRGHCCECGEPEWLNPGSGLCNCCVTEYAERARQHADDMASGLVGFEQSLIEDFCEFEVDGYGNIS